MSYFQLLTTRRKICVKWDYYTVQPALTFVHCRVSGLYDIKILQSSDAIIHDCEYDW